MHTGVGLNLDGNDVAKPASPVTTDRRESMHGRYVACAEQRVLHPPVIDKSPTRSIHSKTRGGRSIAEFIHQVSNHESFESDKANMKVALNIVFILAAGLIAGLVLRASRQNAPNEVPEGAVVFTNDQPLDVDATRNDEPSKPPEDEAWLSRFELIERSGQKVSSEDLKGRPYVVSFFYSTCPSICVSQNQKLRELQDEFEGQGVRFVAISVDPETDTPEVLREYATRFRADKDQWLFMTGDLDYIRRVGAEIFRQPVDKQFHTERFALVDAEGEIEGFYSWPEPRQMDKLKESIRGMLDDQT
ncbi:SCO family protein [Crateriforma conspicua]|nr:SCO family protein [Crateriforma conspicua]